MYGGLGQWWGLGRLAALTSAAGRGGWPAALQQGLQGPKGPEGRVAPPARRKWRALARAARRQTHPPRAAPCLRRDAHARTLAPPCTSTPHCVRSNGREMAGTLVSCGGREAIPTRRTSSARHPKRGGAPSRRTGDGVGVADGRADGLAEHLADRVDELVAADAAWPGSCARGCTACYAVGAHCKQRRERPWPEADVGSPASAISIHLSISISISIYLYICLHLSIYLSTYLPIYLSSYLSIYTDK